jgi:hypothetical protein
MRKKGWEESPTFLKKKKGGELTKAGTGTRHPLPSGGTVTRGAARTSSSSGRTTTGRPCGTAIAEARNSSSFSGTSSSGGTATEELARLGPPLPLMGPQFGLRQWDLLFKNAHVLCVRDLLFIVHNVSPNGVVRSVHHWDIILILQTRPWIGFRRGAGGQVRVRMNERAVCG